MEIFSGPEARRFPSPLTETWTYGCIPRTALVSCIYVIQHTALIWPRAWCPSKGCIGKDSTGMIDGTQSRGSTALSYACSPQNTNSSSLNTSRWKSPMPRSPHAPRSFENQLNDQARPMPYDGIFALATQGPRPSNASSMHQPERGFEASPPLSAKPAVCRK